MKLIFSSVHIITEKIKRNSLAEPFWPNEYRTFKRQKLVDANKREGWVCQFMDKGLLLNTKIFIAKEDYGLWPHQHQTQNKNTVSSDLEFSDFFEIELTEPQLKIEHDSDLAELVRKKIYISERFQAAADGVWAAQYFFDRNNRSKMRYNLGFDRKVEPDDFQILKNITAELQSIKGIRIYE